MRAGARPHLAELLRSTEARDPETNALVLVWKTFARAWVGFSAPRGDESYVAGATTAMRVVRLTGDSLELADVTPNDRVRLGNGVLVNVTAVLPGIDPRADTVIEGVTGDGVRDDS